MITPLAELVTGLEKGCRFNDKGQLPLGKEVFRPGIAATEIVCPQGAEVNPVYCWHRRFFGPHR